MDRWRNKEKLSCHRLGREKASNFLTEEEEALDGGKSEFHLHAKLAPALSAIPFSLLYSIDIQINIERFSVVLAFAFLFKLLVREDFSVDFFSVS